MRNERPHKLEDGYDWENFFQRSPIQMAHGPVGGIDSRTKKLLAFVGVPRPFVVHVGGNFHSDWTSLEDAIQAYNEAH